MSEAVLTAARQYLAPATVQSLGSCLRSLVTFAHKSRWLPRDVDPMWQVGYSARAEHQGQAPGFVRRTDLPNDAQCAALFDALVEMGEPTWALAMRLAHRSGARWGELIALTPADVGFEPHRVVHIHRAVEQSGHARVIKTTKNTQKRTSIFPASVAADLSGHVERVRKEAGDGALIFPGAGGGLAERRQFLRLWHRAAARAAPPHADTDSCAVAPPRPASRGRLLDAVRPRPRPCPCRPPPGPRQRRLTLSRYVGVRSGADARTNELTATW